MERLYCFISYAVNFGSPLMERGGDLIYLFLGKGRSRRLQLQLMKLVSLKLDYSNSNLYMKKYLLDCTENEKADFVFWWGNKINYKCKGGIADVQKSLRGMDWGLVLLCWRAIHEIVGRERMVSEIRKFQDAMGP